MPEDWLDTAAAVMSSSPESVWNAVDDAIMRLHLSDIDVCIRMSTKGSVRKLTRKRSQSVACALSRARAQERARAKAHAQAARESFV